MNNLSDEQIIYSNGISTENDGYSLSLSSDELFELIQIECDTRSEIEKEYFKVLIEGQNSQTLGLPPGYDETDLKQAGWGIIFPQGTLTKAELKHYQALNQALKVLIDYRRQQMEGREPHVFRCKANWDYMDFLWEEGRKVEYWNMKPNIVPYYLCIVASPERISWKFQQSLGDIYAVGRLWFDDPEDCVSYIKHLLKYEQNQTSPSNCREVLFMGTQHENDPPTEKSSTQLVKPLYDWLLDKKDLQFSSSLLLGKQSGQEAFKTNLLKRLTAVTDKQFQLPSLLFTACHGVELPASDLTQSQTQGALICQEYPNPYCTLVSSDYLAGHDVVNTNINLSGLMSFCFACYSAGTPLQEDWIYPGLFNKSENIVQTVFQRLFQKPEKIAQKPFVANLPQKLLAHGCTAFIGHVSKTWDTSYLGVNGENNQLDPFLITLEQLLKGVPVGHATDDLTGSAVRLTKQLHDQMENRSKYSPKQIENTWKARNDFRGYVVLGDPAAKIQID